MLHLLSCPVWGIDVSHWMTSSLVACPRWRHVIGSILIVKRHDEQIWNPTVISFPYFSFLNQQILKSQIQKLHHPNFRSCFCVTQLCFWWTFLLHCAPSTVMSFPSTIRACYKRYLGYSHSMRLSFHHFFVFVACHELPQIYELRIRNSDFMCL